MQTVHYDASKDSYIYLGHRANVVPIDHPDKENVSNGNYVLTTPVSSINMNGSKVVSFTTKNTHYIAKYPDNTSEDLNQQEREALHAC